MLGLAQLGATVVMVSRNGKRGEMVRDEIRARSGNPAVDVIIADLSSQESIRGLVNRFTAERQGLHVLVNNAGVYFTTRHATVDRLEVTFAVNHLAQFLLANLLLDVLKRSAPARVINVSGACANQWPGRVTFRRPPGGLIGYCPAEWTS